MLLRRKKDVHFLAGACQVHEHTTTCFKYWKGPLELRSCHFGLDKKNFIGRSYVDDKTGDLYLQYLDRMVNCFNDMMLKCVHCNMDIQFVGSGPSVKAILYYTTDYITKTQLKAHVAYLALDIAVSKVGEYDPTADELRLHAKRLLQKCAYAMISHQELSAQQVCSYLLDHGDHYTSHSYRCLYWTSFESVIKREIPSPERYHCSVVPTIGDDQDTGSDSDSDDVASSADGGPTAVVVDAEVTSEDTAALAANEFVIGTDDDGNVVLCSNHMEDYHSHPCELDYVCLWDFCT